MASPFADFNTGTGLGLRADEIMSNLFIGVPITLIGAWLIWTIYKSYKGWATGKISLYDMASVSIQAFIVTTFMVVFLT